MTDEEREPQEPMSELVSQLAREVGDLVNTHMQLARVELMSDLQQAGRGSGMLGSAGILGYVGALLGSIAAALGLGEIVPYWLGFLILAAVWAVVAAVLAIWGRRVLKRAAPAQETLGELERDREWLRRRSG